MPSTAEMKAMAVLLRPWELITDPVFYGSELLPDSGPALFVGNHTIFGLLDLPLLIVHVHRTNGLFLRGLGDHAHFKVPLWGDFLSRFGAVDGTRENARELLRRGEAVLVLRGGGREVAKRKGERYRLIWKQRMGFARLAIEAGCPVVPFGAVGGEETYDIIVDADSPVMAPVRMAFERLGGRSELLFPLARGLPVLHYLARNGFISRSASRSTPGRTAARMKRSVPSVGCATPFAWPSRIASSF